MHTSQLRSLMNAIHYDAGRRLPRTHDHTVHHADTCIVPRCTAEPDQSGILCRDHNRCPRCGAEIRGWYRTGSGWVTACCRTWEPVLRRTAWLIPWLLFLRSQPFTHHTRCARILVGKATARAGLPWPKE